MKAMILAAGRGERMRPLTDDTPKPLLQAGRHTLIEHQIIKLAQAGFNDIIINLAYMGEKIKQHLGDGSKYDVAIQYSPEAPEGLESAGGIIKALPLLGNQPFVVVNADLITNFNYETLKTALKPEYLAHLILVPNPDFHPQGDFNLNNGHIGPLNDPSQSVTYSGIGVFNPALFNGLKPTRQKLKPLLDAKSTELKVSAELYEGKWLDVGTPERLQLAQQMYQ